MKARHVTFCAYDGPNTIGGPVAWIQRLLPCLRQHGIESRCLFLAWGEDGAAVRALRAQGFDCPSTPCSDRTEHRLSWLLDQLRESPPDVFVPNLPVAAYFAGRWVREAGIPTIGILHSDDDFYRGIQDEFVFGCRPFRLSRLVCVSRELERQVLARGPRDNLVHRIPYGVPVPARTVRRQAGTLRLAYVGRLAEEQKRISDTARALCRVTTEVQGSEAVIYGDGPDRENVETILAAAGNEDHVTLAGRVPSDQIQERLLDCDVLVLLSDYEGLPIAVMEAMACGCVPVCLDMRSGIPELIQDGVNGLLVKDRKESFVAAVRTLYNDPDLLERLSRAARETIEAEYSFTQCAGKWAKLLREANEPSQGKKPLRIPKRLRLPPRNPALESEENRSTPPPLLRRLQVRSRMLAGRLKRRLLGQPIP